MSRAVELDVARRRTLFVIDHLRHRAAGALLVFAGLQDRRFARRHGGARPILWDRPRASHRARLGARFTAAAVSPTFWCFIAVGMIWRARASSTAGRCSMGPMCSWRRRSGVAAACRPASPSRRQSCGSSSVSMTLAVLHVPDRAELWRERRQAAHVALACNLRADGLHGAVFCFRWGWRRLSPPARRLGLGRLSVAVLTLLVVLLCHGRRGLSGAGLAKDRTVDSYKMAATTDPLTGVLNRRGFFEAMRRDLMAARRKKEPVSVLAFDLDQFKSDQ